jgi:7-carboxy-7-deazaguanine synthase
MALGAAELTISEVFVSVQGEGPSAGEKAAFLRLGHCNLSCSYCDTPYTWDFERYDEAKELRRVPFSELTTFLLDAGPGRVVVTGGEPLIQHKPLERLFLDVDQRAAERAELPWPETGGRLLIEVETNGTIVPTAGLALRVNQWNVSPKLRSSGEPPERRFRENALRWFAEQPNAYFKFVVDSGESADEALELALLLGVPKGRVLFMPEAKNRHELETREHLVEGWAKQRDVRFTSRVHLKLWDGERGR